MKAKLTYSEVERDEAMIIEGDFHIPYSVIARKKEQNISKVIGHLDNMINKLEHK